VFCVNSPKSSPGGVWCRGRLLHFLHFCYTIITLFKSAERPDTYGLLHLLHFFIYKIDIRNKRKKERGRGYIKEYRKF